MDEVRTTQSNEEQLRILEMYHCDPTSGHFGVKKTCNQVRLWGICHHFDLHRQWLDPFPTTKQVKFINRVVGREVENIYCLCRGIWVVGEDDMYQCNVCFEWYHQSCMLSLPLIDTFDHAWVCTLCP